MRLKPFLDAVDSRVSLVPELVPAGVFDAGLQFLFPNLVLTGGGEDPVDFIMKVSGLEGFPFVFVQPNASAAGTVFHIKIESMSNLVFQQNPPASRTEFREGPN